MNALVVYLLPLAFAAAVGLFANDYSNGGTRVVGIDPDRAYVWTRRLQFIGGYLGVLAPFAMAAASRTFVHARRWLENGKSGVLGILEAGLCGLAGAVLVLLPGTIMQPAKAPPYLLAYGGMSAILGVGVGAILWVTGSIAVRFVPRRG